MIYCVAIALNKNGRTINCTYPTVHATSAAEAVGIVLPLAMESHPGSVVAEHSAQVVEGHPFNVPREAQDARYYSLESQWLVFRLEGRTREQVEAILGAAGSLPYDKIFKDGHTIRRGIQ